MFINCSNVRVVPVGMTKAVKKLVRGSVPNLSKYNDISDFVLRYDTQFFKMHTLFTPEMLFDHRRTAQTCHLKLNALLCMDVVYQCILFNLN